MAPQGALAGGGLGMLIILVLALLFGANPMRVLQEVERAAPPPGAGRQGAAVDPEQEELKQFVDPRDEVLLDTVRTGLRRQLEQLREERLALDDDRDDEIDLVLEVDVDRPLGTPGCLGDLPRRRAAEPVLADQLVRGVDDAPAKGGLGVDRVDHE